MDLNELTDNCTADMASKNMAGLTEKRRGLNASRDGHSSERVTFKHVVEVAVVRVLTNAVDD